MKSHFKLLTVHIVGIFHRGVISVFFTVEWDLQKISLWKFVACIHVCSSTDSCVHETCCYHIYRPASLANDTMICEHGCYVVFMGFHSTL